MSDTSLREKIHQLVDNADESQLDAVLEVLKPSQSLYTRDEIDSFYKRADQFEQSGSPGLSVQESHERLRQRLKNGL